MKKAPLHTLGWAPIGDAKRRALRRDLDNLKVTAARKQVTLDRYDEEKERAAGNAHFELGCWLFFYSTRISKPDGFAARVDCARRIYESGFTHLGYEFFTVFDFGERQYDTLVEMGDGTEVIAALRGLLAKDTSGNLARAFAYNHWPLAE